ncbi:uncharacterized protein LOC123192915 isoform X3 [Mangifera indica]|uniref:uncharacterized protein LOC123192915 isoform X3 n=1 Tax=Mangifera indica TaxID=29780 RepID=UPI001CF9A5CC|nr:uncharacterized protein LOC123192915 isoform X3 [Mangifera indica]
MPKRFQAAALVAAPSYPSAIAWSDENLIAVASDHLVTILNPAFISGPRGLITIQECKPYSIGVVKREDLLSGCLLSTCLHRDRHPCVESISWSPIGMAANSGCLLAVCTTEGRVKVYRPPFCDFGAEWIEVVDISDRIYDYFANIDFEELDNSAEFSAGEATEHADIDDIPISMPRKKHKLRRISDDGSRSSKGVNARSSESTNITKVMEIKSNKLKGENSRQIISITKSKGKPVREISSNCTLPQITPDEYASRCAMLHSLVVAWSPMLRFSSKNFPIPQNGSSSQFSVLAIGGKSGKISFWRISAPKCYSIEHSNIDPTLVQVGLLQAHNSWITAISWALLSSNSSNPQVLLVTGSSDGSVRIWTGYTEDLLNSVEVHHAPFSILREVTTANTIPISVLSICVPAQSLHQILLAIGKGSGSFDIWICDISSNKFENVGSYDTQGQVVTGLAWAFDGSSLYSCSQDNFVRGWVLHGNTLVEVPIPSNTLGLKNSTDLPDVFVSCLGVALSPGDLILAVVRNFDLDTLDHMYQARAHKAAVEFFWIGGQQIDALSNTSLEYGLEAFPDFSGKELATWESNILWSLKQYEDQDKPLVVWDVMVALLAFKRSIPKYVECVLVKWLSTFCLQSHVHHSTEKILSNVHKNLSNNSSRRLHLLNIICRCVMLTEMKADDINNKHQKSRGSEEEQLSVWMELLLNSEKELRERLMSLTFSAFITLTSHSSSTCVQASCWCPDGISQMERWVAQNHETAQVQLRALASEVVGLKRRRLKSMPSHHL